VTTNTPNTVTIKGDTYETVTTHALQIGDVIRAEGALLEPRTRNEGPDRVNNNASGNVVWLRGYTISDEFGAIPKSWLTRDEDGEGYWLVQGNGRATWLRLVPQTARP
jgi:hypothetical protein